MKITIVGIGYVGLSLAILLSTKHSVVAIDTDNKKISMINNKEFDYLNKNKLNLVATSNKEKAYTNSDLVILALPTNFNNETCALDTSIIESVLKDINQYNKNAIIVIKSTVNIGFSKYIASVYPQMHFFFSPEFLKENTAIQDSFYPSRIVVGYVNKTDKDMANTIANLFLNCAENKCEILITGSLEAESIKLFSNTYLAMRISYFNELDTFAELNDLNTKDIIKGVCLDSRIGDFYNNPSFGYGGYCLPKDTKQLKSTYKNAPENLISSIVESNNTRNEFITNRIVNLLNSSNDIVGIYRLTMKKDSDNFRFSAIKKVIQQLLDKGIKVIIYEPLINDDNFMNANIIKDLDSFKKQSSIIVANRYDKDLNDVQTKVYTRDIFNRD